MTRDELLTLSITKVVDLVLEYQLTIEQLQTRVSELEGRLSTQEANPGAHLWPPAAAQAPEQEPSGRLFPSGALQVLPTADPEHHSHRSHRTSSSWSRRLNRAFNVDGALSWRYIMIGLAIVLVAAVMGLLIVQFNLPLGVTTGRR